MSIKRTYIFIGLFLSLITSFAQATILTTEFKTSPSYLVASGAGNMFDVNVSGDDLLVTGIEIHTSIPSNGDASGTVNLFTRSGTYFGNETNALGWNLVDMVGFTSAGFGNPTFIDIADFVLSGGVTGFYVTLSEASFTTTRMRSTVGPVGTTGNVAVSNSDLDIRVGIGLTQPFFSGNISYARTWNGSIHYEVAQVPEPSTLVLMGLGLLGLFGPGSKRRAPLVS